MRHVEDKGAIVMITGARERPDRLPAGLAAAGALHAGVLAFAVAAGLLEELHGAVADDRARLHDYFDRQYEVAVARPADEARPAPPPEAPPREPARAPAPRAATRPQADDPYGEAAPTPARATKVLTADPKADAPIDLPTVVSGDGRATYGRQSGEGEGDAPTMDRAARLDGVPEGRRPAAVARSMPPTPPALDRSRPVQLAGSSSWSCPFPPEADADQVDQAVVTVQVTVRPDGSALSASVVEDPGHGFGRAARVCALARRYQPALDRSGSPTSASAPVNVRFSR